MSALLVRSAVAINRCDLQRSHATFADNKAKQMMGAANPLTGSDIRKPASTHCPSCGRWHRPGNICPAARKSLINEGGRAMPNTLHGQDLLNWKPEPTPEPAPQECEQQLVDGSGFLQNQQNAYVDKLRQWLARYGV